MLKLLTLAVWLLVACGIFNQAPDQIVVVTQEVTREVTREVIGEPVEESTAAVFPTQVQGPTSRPSPTIIPDSPPEPSQDGPFLLAIEDVLSIAGRGTLATGKIERGGLQAGDPVDIVGLNDEIRSTTVTSIEFFGEASEEAAAGDNVALLLRGISTSELARGMVIAAPGSIEARRSFEANIYILTVAEGGRNQPFLNGYRPQFYFRTIDITGEMLLAGGAEMALPGSTVSITVELFQPVALEVGTWFAIREGGQQIGYGVVTAILD